MRRTIAGLLILALLTLPAAAQEAGKKGPDPSDRSYFGVIRVKGIDGADSVPAHLLHGLRYRSDVRVPASMIGMNLAGLGQSSLPLATLANLWSDPWFRSDFSRLATTYYHRGGPVGKVMEQFKWFIKQPEPNKINQGKIHKVDARNEKITIKDQPIQQGTIKKVDPKNNIVVVTADGKDVELHGV